MRSIAVVGASLAGLRAVESLRREGYEGAIHLIGDEQHRPYDRPPLSKQVLAGEWETDRVWLCDDAKLEALDVDAHFGQRAIGLDVATRKLVLGDANSMVVDGVVIATGARCRTIGTSLSGVYTLRTLDDAAAIRTRLASKPERLVVVGAGFIGAEVAATARGLGVAVTMIEMAAVPFERSLGESIGAVLADVHRDHGVDVRLGVGVAGLIGDGDGDGEVRAVELTNGERIDTDLVVVGIGVIPNVEWLESSGLDISDGVLCDSTSAVAPGIVAAGDVARWPSRRFGETMRVEHWDNAITQATHAAKRLVHGVTVGDYDPTPWFWSDQFDRKIQLAGRTTGSDQFEITHGDVASRTFAGIYGRAGRIVAVVGFNRPRHVMRYRALIDAQASFDDALAADI